ncbi:hypothetical protein [Geodermatophilus chilensis]|nr:hypothetical protein [Geodermatophilus chilensis]
MTTGTSRATSLDARDVRGLATVVSPLPPFASALLGRRAVPD